MENRILFYFHMVTKLSVRILSARSGHFQDTLSVCPESVRASDFNLRTLNLFSNLLGIKHVWYYFRINTRTQLGAQMRKRRFVTYKILVDSLIRAKIEKPGTTATVFLECFVNLNGELKAKYVESKGLCNAGEFKVWRDSLLTKGWLGYSLGSYSKHIPGPNLLKYINKEKLASLEIASIADVNSRILEAKEEMATKEELVAVKEKLESRVSLLEKAVKNMIEEFDPPVTDEKIQRRLKVVCEK